MKPDGTLERDRPRLAEVLNMPERSLGRHLTWLAEHGWLQNTRRGGNGRWGRWEAHQGWTSKVPPGEVVGHERPATRKVVGHERPATPESCGPATRTQLGEVVGHPVARYKNLSERSEVRAVDPDRVRRTTPDAARDAASDATPADSPATTADPDVDDTPLAKVIPLFPRRRATTDPTPLKPPADGHTEPAAGPTQQAEPQPRDAGGAGGRRFGPPKRHATTGTDP
jgi:hypothetical protein